jgi:acyl-CoA synthetase (AMP-forming)/AMP-acid ligase II
MLSGGAPIAPEVVRRILQTFGCDYVQTYGMTETSPYLTVSLLDEHLRALSHDEQLCFKCKTGRPFRSVELRVVDAAGQPVPADEHTVGEIQVRGPTVTPGYWQQPQATAEAFVDGWLRTGDLAVLDREGYVDIVDRSKDMIITGGENVYSIEVENAISTHPAVAQVAVIGIPDDTWGEAVHAVVVLREGATATPDELISHARASIAGYKVPKSVELRAEPLPLSGAMKVLKRELREPHWAGRARRVN